jgi:GNAT superfamily N-acetyltransferase
MIHVHIADSFEKTEKCREVLFDFRPQLNPDNFWEVISKLQAGGSVIIYIEEDGKAVAIGIFETGYKIHRGHYLYIDDLATLPAYRKKGYAARLLEWIELYARDRGIEQIHLDSGVQRFDAHRLYLSNHFNITGHHFAKTIL